MGVYRFEDLRVWQAAKQQCDWVGVLICRPIFRRDRELCSQMNDAAISVMFNISEGFLRRRDKETLQFLRYSFASNGELKAGYYAADGREYISQSETAELIALNESIAKMLRRWQGTLESGQPERARGKRARSRPNPGRAKRRTPTTDQGTDQGPKDGPGTKDQGRTKH